MAFESLSFRMTVTINDFPYRWLPLIHLYDPDLPLFPIYYFHVLPSDFPEGQRPTDIERAYGFIEKVSLNGDALEVSIVTNKDLNSPQNTNLLQPVINEIKERFGLIDPVELKDVSNAFKNQLVVTNQILHEMWQRVVANAYGNILPFGRLWDAVLGLTRFVASWYSPGGRKGELIETHYFASKFGEQIQSAGHIPSVDFYLLPTISELTDSNNPLTSFPKYARLKEVANRFHNNYCEIVNINGVQISKFCNPYQGALNTEKLLNIFQGTHIPYILRPYAFECFNSFDKGPQRTIIFLLMLDDIANGRLSPLNLTSAQCGSIYDGLNNTYQSPKVIEIYAQQSFGNPSAMPIDTWISSMFKWPLCVYPTDKIKKVNEFIFSNATNLGKVERLLWVTAQSRKVHSSACNDAFWCLKLGSSKSDREKFKINEISRGANPLACNICIDSVRHRCPAYSQIKDKSVSFNSDATGDFHIETSSQNNITPNQTFLSCRGYSIYGEILDVFSTADDSNGFAPYPDKIHNGGTITVDDFISLY
ncbi:MAG: hypothetical protein ABSE72_10380 [Bacteroidales bacterium]